MKYFKYVDTGSMGRVWSLFAELADETEEEKLGKAYYNVQYAHTLEIVNAAMRGSLPTDDDSLNSFNLRAYECKCRENDNNDQRKQAEKLLYIVDDLGEEENGVGYGDISEKRVSLNLQDLDFAEIDDLAAFEDSLSVLYNLRKQYITEEGVDVISILLNSLRGIPDAVSSMKKLVLRDSVLRDLVLDLCECSRDGALIERLEAVV